MSDFTYEKENRTTSLEKYEWDNLWIECTDNNESKRVLYIGDSISCGTRKIATAMTNEKILFDGFGTSKGLDNPFFKDSVHLFALQLPKTDLILFNNGLHGFHLDDKTEYARYYEEMVQFLLNEHPKVPLFLLLTTYVNDEEDLKRVKLRNQAALNTAEKYHLPVIDLYTVTENNKELLTGDGVHFTVEGYKIIAKEIICAIDK